MLSVSVRSGTEPWLRRALVTAAQRPCQDETLSYRTFIMCLILLLVTGLPGAHSNVLKAVYLLNTSGYVVCNDIRG